MTLRDTGHVLAMVRLWWPHSNLGDDPEQVLAVWHEALEPFDRATVERALHWIRGGREHAPPVGVVVSAVQEALYGPPPSFDDMQRWLSNNVRLLTYGETNTPDHTVQTLEQLAEAGAHEAVLRFVASHGVYAVRMMPDPAMGDLEIGPAADRRDRARDYQHRVVPEWRADPRPGLALERARRSAVSGGRGGTPRRLDPMKAIGITTGGET